MAKRGSGAPSAARPKGATTALADALTPSSRDTVSPAAKGGSAKSPRASAKKSPADDVPVELQVIFGENSEDCAVEARPQTTRIGRADGSATAIPFPDRTRSTKCDAQNRGAARQGSGPGSELHASPAQRRPRKKIATSRFGQLV